MSVCGDLLMLRAVGSCSVTVLQCKPPFVPPKGEVNAAHAFQIGVFEDDDVKGIKAVLFVSYCSTY